MGEAAEHLLSPAEFIAWTAEALAAEEERERNKPVRRGRGRADEADEASDAVDADA